jgi:hypothetical protein
LPRRLISASKALGLALEAVRSFAPPSVIGMHKEICKKITEITIPHCKHLKRCFSGSFMRLFYQNPVAEAISVRRRPPRTISPQRPSRPASRFPRG